MRTTCYSRWVVLAAICAAWISSVSATGATSLSFSQLDWDDSMGITQDDSAWGQVTVQFTGASNLQFFNLNIGGDWVVENLDIASLHGVGVTQTISTYFDLGVDHGTDVNSLDYIYSLGTSPIGSMPTGILTNATVDDIPFVMGGLGSADLDELDVPARGGGGHDGGGREVRLEGIAEFLTDHNQSLGRNDCVRGSVSNSLNYLKSRKHIPDSVPSTIEDMSALFQDGGTPRRTSKEWVNLKANDDTYRRDIVTTRIDRTVNGKRNFFNPENYNAIFNALEQGADVELIGRKEGHGDSNPGHVMWIVGMRQDARGEITLDVIDDNQGDGRTDGIKSYRLRNRQEHEDDNFVVLLEPRLYVDSFVIEDSRARRRARAQQNSSNAQSRGNSVIYDPFGAQLSFGGDFIVDTGYGADPLVGAEVVLPDFTLREVDLGAGTALFDRATLAPMELKLGADTVFTGWISKLSYSIDENLFYGAMFDPMRNSDPSFYMYDPTLTPINSPYLDEIEALLDPSAGGFDPDNFFYFTFSPDQDFFASTDAFNQFATSSGQNAMFLAHEVPVPSTLFLASIAALTASVCRRRPGFRSTPSH